MRYQGQSYELTVPWEGASLETALKSFHAQHERRYTYSDETLPVEIVSVRVVGSVASPDLPHSPADSEEHTVPSERTAPVIFADGQVKATLLDRKDLRAGGRFDGPAVLTQDDCTTVVPPGWTATVDRNLSILLTHQTK